MKVFISHAHKDKDVAKSLAEKLEEMNVHPWVDEKELRPGSSWEEQIKEAVIESNVVVVVLGEGEPSPNVLVEAGMALGQGKRVLPVVLGGESEPNVFSNLQQVYVYGDNTIDSAASQIAHMVSEDEEML